MANNKIFKVNDTVFYFDSWGNLREATVIEVIKDKKDIWVKTHLKDGGTAGAKMADCYATKQECLDAEKARIEKQVAEYKVSIKDVESLVRFCLEYNISGDPEYGDAEARRAARERAKELLGIEIEH